VPRHLALGCPNVAEDAFSHVRVVQLIEFPHLIVDFGREDALMAQGGQSAVKPSHSSEEVDEP
jgi:hypothetical protein